MEKFQPTYTLMYYQVNQDDNITLRVRLFEFELLIINKLMAKLFCTPHHLSNEQIIDMFLEVSEIFIE